MRDGIICGLELRLVLYDYNSNFDSCLLLYSYLIPYMYDINQSDDQIQYNFLQDSVFPNLAITLCWYIELWQFRCDSFK